MSHFIQLRSSRVVAACVLGALFGCSAPPSPEDPRVFVLRESAEGGELCFKACGVRPDGEVEPDLCGGTSDCRDLVAGFDRLKVIVVHGSFALRESVTVPDTKIELRLNGTALPETQAAAMDMTAPASVRKRHSSVANIALPASSEGTLEVRAEVNGQWVESEKVLEVRRPLLALRATGVCAGADRCELARSTGEVTFELEAPVAFQQQTINVEFSVDGVHATSVPFPLHAEGDRAVGRKAVKTPGHGSRWEAVAAAAGLVSPPLQVELVAPSLQLVVTGCFAGTPCHLTRGTGTVELQLIAAANFSAEDALFEGRVEGEPFALLASKKFEIRDGVKVARATINVPDRGTTWQVQGFAANTLTATEDITLDGPVIEVTSDDCPQATGCVLEGGVGHLDVVVRAPREFRDPKVRVLEYLDGLPKAVAEHAYVRLNDRSEAVIRLPTPESARDWRLRLETGGETLAPWVIELLPPTIELRVLECGSNDPCVIAAGTTVNVSVSGPAELRNPDVVLAPSLDGVPTGVHQTVKLDQVGAQRRSGIGKLTVPTVTKASVWQPFGLTGPYRYFGPAIQVTP